MKKRTRLFLLIAAGILIAGLGTGLVASYANLQNFVLIGGDGPAELDYLPADAHLVAYADVREVMDSGLRRRLESNFGGAPDGAREKFHEATGVNPETDIDHIAAAVSGQDEASQRPLVVVQGRFDTVRIEGAVREHGGSVENYAGKRLMIFGDGQADMALAFAEPGLLVVGPVAAVHRALDRKASGGASIKSNDELMRLIRDVNDGNAWAVARFDAITGRGRLPKEVASKIPPISWFAVKGVIDDGVRGIVRAEARDDASGQDLREVVRGMMALVRMQAGSQPQFAELLNSLELSGQGKTVALAFSIPPEMIDALSAMHAQRRLEAPEQPEPPDAPEPPEAPEAPEPPEAPAPPAPPAL